MSASPSGPPPSGPPPSGPPPGPPPSGPPPAGPPAGAPPSSTPPASGGGFELNRNQLIAIGVVIALIIGVLVGVLAAGGGGDDESANGSGGGGAEQPIKLEPIAATSNAPFTPPVAPDTPTPSTIVPPPAGQGPFGGTGDNTLCDRDQLIRFLTDSGRAREAQEWARVVGISVSDIPTYIRDLIPTVLSSDTRVTNHTFQNGRAVPLQSVLQAGTAVLVDEFGRLVARCRCGNPLLEPTKVTNPVYTGPKWPAFDPTIIVIVVAKSEPVYPKGGVTEPTTWTLRMRAEAPNIRGTRDSTTVVDWGGTFNVDGSTLSGTGSGTIEFNGGCYTDNGTGTLIGPVSSAGTFDVQISGTASGTIPNRTFALTFAGSGWQVTANNGPPNEPNCNSDNDPSGFIEATTELFATQNLASTDGPTQVTLGEYSVTFTLEAAGTDAL